ncbi:MAG: HAD hydrolase-like protein [Bradymonadaceae bacterium]|nr:HAD hydrolase-like protein [Lujinxingiaceae bacterium]
MSEPAHIALSEIIASYDALLIDAYGVLVHEGGAFEGAQAFIEQLNASQKPYAILTNDASRLAKTLRDSLLARGLSIDEQRLVTAGSLLIPYFEENGLQGARCVVIGPPDSHRYVELAGGIEVALEEGVDFDVLALCDNAGFDFVATVNMALTELIRAWDTHRPVKLLLPNPDLFYQQGPKRYGMASGSVALMLEAALNLRFPGAEIAFARLGKPHALIYAEGCRRVGTRNVVMLGDQLLTDIQGANEFGIDSALVTTGLSSWSEEHSQNGARPTYVLTSLQL